MDSLVNTFVMKATAVGAQVECCATKESAFELITRLLEKEAIFDAQEGYAVWAQSEMLTAAEKSRLAASIPGLKFEVTREMAAQAKVGISQMDWALADTGTVVQTADAVDKRLVSTLPMLHIALVSKKALLPDLTSLLDRIHPDQAAYFAFITGPSRTADIERVLTIGVHGPERFIVIMVDDLEVAA
jgi:L-lactate dehydrogenase complex protein LldG